MLFRSVAAGRITADECTWLLRVAAAYATECERHRESAPSAMTQPYCVFDMEPYPCPTVCAREAVERG